MVKKVIIGGIIIAVIVYILTCRPPLIKADIHKYDDSFLTLTNTDTTFFTNIKVSINDEYYYSLVPDTLFPGKSINIVTKECVNSENIRFDYDRIYFRNFNLSAKVGYGEVYSTGVMRYDKK